MCGKYYEKVINVAKNILQIELKRYNNSPVCELKDGDGKDITLPMKRQD